MTAKARLYVTHPAPLDFLQRERETVNRRTDHLPVTIRDALRERHRNLEGAPCAFSTSPVALANSILYPLLRDLKAANVARAYDDEAVRIHSDNYARLAGRSRTAHHASVFAAAIGVRPPDDSRLTPRGCLLRLSDPRWWRRNLRKSWTRNAEAAARDIGLIRKGRAPYATDEAVNYRAAQRRRQREYMQRMEAVNDLGQTFELFDLVNRSTANPAIRRGEFMARASGFEEVAAFHGHAALFITMTCPSRFHAEGIDGRNPSHTRETIRDGQGWLCKVWARARAKFKRLSLLFYGFRIVEPHHDGTPHWHILLFVPTHQVETLRFVLRAYALSDSPLEPGAAQRRISFEEIDSAKGSAVGYVAKYVAKNIDAAGAIGNEADGETGGSIHSSLERIDAWASVGGIRQFQQMGGPSVTCYREFRRLRDPVSDPDLERIRAAADAGNFGSYVFAGGGIGVGRKTNQRLEKVETGARNCYGEVKPPQIVGVRYASAVEITRERIWRIQRKGFTQGAVSVVNPQGTMTALDQGTEETGSDRPAAPFFSVFSDLGPVSITVRSDSDPSDWCNPLETSTGPP